MSGLRLKNSVVSLKMFSLKLRNNVAPFSSSALFRFRPSIPLTPVRQMSSCQHILQLGPARALRNNRSIRYSSTTSNTSNEIPLSARMKNAASFTFYSGLVLGGIGLTGLVIYYFVHDILLPTSDVQVFNRAFGIVEKDPRCQQLLGGGRIKAYGEHTDNKWARSRPIASRRGYDGRGKEHLIMQFHVQGDLAEGLVRLEMIESDEKHHAGIGSFDFRYLLLEIPGQPRVYLIDNSNQPPKKTSNTGFLGVRWGPKKGDE
jgi:import inner membrane translocase subunit TIM21